MVGKSPLRSVDVLVEGKVYVHGRIMEACIGIDNGEITSVSKRSLAPRAEKRVRYEGKKVILPGMVDIHVHLRDLNQEYKEDWYTGTLSALRGGVTAVIDMPNNVPPIDSYDRLLMKLERASRRALVDFGFYMGYPLKLEDLRKARKFIVGVKLYPQDLYEEKLRVLFNACLNEDIPVVVHAEDPKVLSEKASVLREKGIELGPKIHTLLRPPEAELRAVRKVLALKREFKGLKVHFTHISLRDSLKEVLLGKLEGDVTFDVTLHHALLDESIYDTPLGRISKVNPPLRPSSDREAIFSCLQRMLADALITDHAPHSLSEKLSDDYESTPPGFPGLEVALPILFTEILEGRLPLGVLDLYSSKPANIFGLTKGDIRPGMDGDLAVVDYSRGGTIKGEEFSSKAKYTPFEGRTVRALILDVYLRGVRALEEGNLQVEGGFGKLVRKSGDKFSWN